MYENPELGWDPVRILRTPWVGLPVEKAMPVMIKQLASERVSEVVVTPESLGVSEEDLVAASLPLRRAGFGVRLVSSFVISLPPRARVEGVKDVSWLALERPPLRAGALSKRALDLIGGLVFLVLGVLPFLVLMVGKTIRGKLWEPREVFEGRWGESLTVRRMAGRESLASYPLLLKVLRGQMSLVGPRPLRPGEPVPGGEEWHRVREHHRPGLVGPWSLVRARTPQEEMHQELRYLEDWSPELDLKLLTRVALRRPREPNNSEAAPVEGPRRPHSART
jgi:lipopolysaccharide/colanic/teichoic acid biosynthesis glycosyltransferase